MNQEQVQTNATVYEIEIKEHLEERWADWFEGMTIAHQSDGSTVLRGPIADQAALHGLLNKIRDLSLSLVSVRQEAASAEPSLEPQQEETS